MCSSIRTVCAALFLSVVLIGEAFADTIKVDGVDRTYILAGARSAVRAPLVIVLHGQGGTGQQMTGYTQWDEVAASERFVVAFPDAIGGSWALKAEPNADVTFIIQLVNKLVADKVADPRRVYVTGLSRGGAFTYILACERPDYFAAAAPIIVSVSAYMLSQCSGRKPMPVALMNGTADPLIPYKGGMFSGLDGPVPLVSTDTLVRFWRERNGCLPNNWSETKLPDLDPKDLSRVTRIGSRCDKEREVVLYRIDGGGHQLPSRPATSPPAITAKLGPQNHDIDGAKTIWDFFKPQAL